MSYIIAANAPAPTAEQAKAAALSQFRTSSIILSQMVSMAYANLISSGKATASELSTLTNNMGRLNTAVLRDNAKTISPFHRLFLTLVNFNLNDLESIFARVFCFFAFLSAIIDPVELWEDSYVKRLIEIDEAAYKYLMANREITR